MPNNVPELRSLLGGLSYYRKFLPNLSRRLQPITKLLKKDEPFCRDENSHTGNTYGTYETSSVGLPRFRGNPGWLAEIPSVL